jgi:hypothetical protein
MWCTEVAADALLVFWIVVSGDIGGHWCSSLWQRADSVPVVDSQINIWQQSRPNQWEPANILNNLHGNDLPHPFDDAVVTTQSSFRPVCEYCIGVS